MNHLWDDGECEACGCVMGSEEAHKSCVPVQIRTVSSPPAAVPELTGDITSVFGDQSVVPATKPRFRSAAEEIIIGNAVKSMHEKDAAAVPATEKATCTLCAKVPSEGFFTGCMIRDVPPDAKVNFGGWSCDGNGNLTRSIASKAGGAKRGRRFPRHVSQLLRDLHQEFYGGPLANADAFRWLPEIADYLDSKGETPATDVSAGNEDSARLDWLEGQTKKSPTGISFDWCNYAEAGRVIEKGYRFMRRHFLGERAKTLREAIDAAMGKTSEKKEASTATTVEGQKKLQALATKTARQLFPQWWLPEYDAKVRDAEQLILTALNYAVLAPSVGAGGQPEEGK